MLLEDIYGYDVLSPFQQLVYTELKHALTPVDEAIIDNRYTAFLTKHDGGQYWMDITLTLRTPGACALWIGLMPDGVSLRLGGWHGEMPLAASGKSETAFAASIRQTITAILAGQVKIVEQQASSQGYQWTRFDLINGKWQSHSTTTTKLYNYFGKKTTVERFCKAY